MKFTNSQGLDLIKLGLLPTYQSVFDGCEEIGLDSTAVYKFIFRHSVGGKQNHIDILQKLVAFIKSKDKTLRKNLMYIVKEILPTTSSPSAPFEKLAALFDLFEDQENRWNKLTATFNKSEIKGMFTNVVSYKILDSLVICVNDPDINIFISRPEIKSALLVLSNQNNGENAMSWILENILKNNDILQQIKDQEFRSLCQNLGTKIKKDDIPMLAAPGNYSEFKSMALDNFVKETIHRSKKARLSPQSELSLFQVSADEVADFLKAIEDPEKGPTDDNTTSF